jgi:hypothetical protein
MRFYVLLRLHKSKKAQPPNSIKPKRHNENGAFMNNRRRIFQMFIVIFLFATIGYSACYDLLGRVVSCPALLSASPIATTAKLKAQGYLGGSLLYSNNDTYNNQLVVGGYYPIKLGKLAKTIIDVNQLPVCSDPNATDDCYTQDEINSLKANNQQLAEYNEISCNYGIFKITSINTTNVQASYELFNSDGTFKKSGTFNLNINSKVDMDGDGKNDIEYVSTIPGKTEVSTQRYLNFISNQQNLQTTMFSYDVDRNSSINSNCHLMGFNINGQRLVVVKAPSLAKTVASENFNFSNGDIILDKTGNKYMQIGSSLAKTTVSTATTMTLSKVLASATTVTDANTVAPVGSVDMDNQNNVTGSDAQKSWFTEPQYLAKLNAYKTQCNALGNHWTLSTTGMNIPLCDNEVKVGFSNIVTDIGLDFKKNVSWGKVTGNIRMMAVFDGTLSMQLVQDARLWDAGVVAVNDTFKKSIDIGNIYPIVSPSITIGPLWVGPFIIDLSGKLEAGVKLFVKIKKVGSFGMRVCYMYKSETGFDLTFKGLNTNTKKEKETFYCPNITLQTDIEGQFTPYLDLSLTCTIDKVLYGTLGANAYYGPFLKIKYFRTLTSNLPDYLSVLLQYRFGISAYAEVGAKVTVNLILWKKTWNPKKKWTLWQWPEANYQYENAIDYKYFMPNNTPPSTITTVNVDQFQAFLNPDPCLIPKPNINPILNILLDE